MIARSVSQNDAAEPVKVTYDPAKLPLEKLLVEHFFKMHDPITKDGQGNDKGTQYRSAIFYLTPDQKAAAKAAKKAVDASGKWKNPVVTEMTPPGKWWKAEDHQDYLKKNPGGYTCHFYRQ